MILQVPFLLSLSRFREIASNPELPIFPDIKGKEWARAVIADGRTLSVPVEGGSSRLKHAGVDIFGLQISEHGRWREEHLGAIRAAYGRTPFFLHLFPMLEDIYRNCSSRSLGEFNGAIFELAANFVGLKEVISTLTEMQKEHPRRLEEIRASLIRNLNVNYSIFDALFRLGKDTIFII